MANHDRAPDDSFFEPPSKKQRCNGTRVIWFNKVPSQITINLLQQHLWSKYRLNAQPQLKTVINTHSYFYIEIDAKRSNEFIQQSPISINGHEIILSNVSQEPLSNDDNDCKTMHLSNSRKYRILVSNVPSQCTTMDLRQLFATYGAISSIHCDNNKLCKTAHVDFAQMQSLVHVAEALSMGSLKLKQEILEITIDTDTKHHLLKTKQDNIISDLIKYNFMESTAHNKHNDDRNEEDDDLSICDDDDNESEMSISPNIATADIKIIINTNDKEHGDVDKKEESIDDIDDNEDEEDEMAFLQNIDESILSFEDKLTLEKCKDDLSGRDLEIKTLGNTLKLEQIEYGELYKTLLEYSNVGNAECKLLVKLREDETGLEDVWNEKQKELDKLDKKYNKLECELKNINEQITVHKLHEKNQQIINTKECDEWNRDRLNHQKQLDVLNKTNKNLEDTIGGLKGKSETIEENIETANIAKINASAICIKHEEELKREIEKWDGNKKMIEANELKMRNDINVLKTNLEIEQTKHSKSKLLLRQTVDGIQENLIKINNQNKEKDNLIFSLQKQLQHYQSKYPWLMTL